MNKSKIYSFMIISTQLISSLLNSAPLHPVHEVHRSESEASLNPSPYQTPTRPDLVSLSVTSNPREVGPRNAWTPIQIGTALVNYKPLPNPILKGVMIKAGSVVYMLIIGLVLAEGTLFVSAIDAAGQHWILPGSSVM